jgi:DNA-binding NtrC family response regulator
MNPTQDAKLIQLVESLKAEIIGAIDQMKEAFSEDPVDGEIRCTVKDGYFRLSVVPSQKLFKEVCTDFDIPVKRSGRPGNVYRDAINFTIKSVITEALRMYDWNRSRAARYLGVDRHHLVNQMKKMNVNKEK